MSIAEKIQKFDAILREKQPEVYAALRPPVAPSLAKSHALSQWFAWKDGQEANTDALFLESYRFMSIAEARQGPRMIRASAFRNPLAGLALIVFARRALYCWPILTDLAGDGYFFSPLSRKVIYTFKGEQDEILSSFETFVDFLVAVSLRSPRSQLARIEAEQELRSEYANRGA